MSLETRIVALAQAIGTDIKALNLAQGLLSGLSTTEKSSLVGAINELFIAIGSSTNINDAAGDGNTTETWSADKIFDAIATAKAAVKTELTNGAAAALDTLSELSAALNNDPSFAATIATEIANRVRFDAAQTITAPQKVQACANIGAATTLEVGDTTRDLTADYIAAKA